MAVITITFRPSTKQPPVTILNAAGGDNLDRVYAVRLQDGTSRIFPLENIWEIMVMPDQVLAETSAKSPSATVKKRP